MRSILLTGPWGSDCRLIGAGMSGCQGGAGTRMAIANNCLVPAAGISLYGSFMVACGVS